MIEASENIIVCYYLKSVWNLIEASEHIIVCNYVQFGIWSRHQKTSLSVTTFSWNLIEASENIIVCHYLNSVWNLIEASEHIIVCNYVQFGVWSRHQKTSLSVTTFSLESGRGIIKHHCLLLRSVWNLIEASENIIVCHYLNSVWNLIEASENIIVSYYVQFGVWSMHQKTSLSVTTSRLESGRGIRKHHCLLLRSVWNLVNASESIIVCYLLRSVWNLVEASENIIVSYYVQFGIWSPIKNTSVCYYVQFGVWSRHHKTA